MSVTAKVTCNIKQPQGDGQVRLDFCPDYQDGRNKDWAKYTPSLSLSMTVVDGVAERFEQGGKYTLTFTPTED